MATKTTATNAAQIEGWLRDIQFEPSRAIDPVANWRFEVKFPPGSQYQFSVLNPKKPERSVIVVAQANLATEHLAAHGRLDDDAKVEFNVALQEALTRDYVEFQLLGAPLLASCPIGFQVQSVIFDDGLSLDTLAFRMSCTYKTILGGSRCIHKHLGPGGTDISGQFDFKRLGVQ